MARGWSVVRFSFFWLVLVWRTLYALEEPCPPGCICTDNSYEPEYTVFCTAKEFTSVPQQIPSKTTHLDLSLNRIGYLPPNAFAHLPELLELMLVGNNISEISEEAFSGLKYLKVLNLQDNKLNTVPAKALKGLKTLSNLQLDSNKIVDIPPDSFTNLTSLKYLWLENNQISSMPVEAINNRPSLEAITLGLNNIEEVPDNAFRNLTNLAHLYLHKNKIRHMGDSSFYNLGFLINLDLSDNELQSFPKSFYPLNNLIELNLEFNEIKYIPDRAFIGMKNLMKLDLRANDIESVGHKAFINLPKLVAIKISDARDLMDFPDLTGTTSLTEIGFDRCSIKEIPKDLCHFVPNLKSLDMHSNKLTEIPDLSKCKNLKIINLAGNMITSLAGKPFYNLSQLLDLTLNHNLIRKIPEDAFHGLKKLEYLDLNNNGIEDIHSQAFKQLGNLEDLNLSNNQFSTIPPQVYSKLRILKTSGNLNLQEFLPASSLPEISHLMLTYPYHCCEFLDKNKGDPIDFPGSETIVFQPDFQSSDNMDYPFWSSSNFSSFPSWNENASSDLILDSSYYVYYDADQDEEWLAGVQDVYDDIVADYGYFGEDFIQETTHFKPERASVKCAPQPDPFTPCDDLMTWWPLRFGVWIVFLLAVVGNTTVIFVNIISRTKLDVPRFLICNLACADLFMGVYLGFLAIIDAQTLGEFKIYAVHWQNSAGCKVAGFLAVISSELSVFTLTVITVERLYAITHAMHLNKRLKLKGATIIMAVGWLFAIFCATLPLLDFSSYNFYAICLPFRTSSPQDKGYLLVILLLNACCFFIIVGCYTKIYWSIRGSHAWNSNDSRVARRMALLVFTDFICWAPICFFSVTSMFGRNFISVDGAKWLTIFVLPFNSCANPFLYAIFTKQFKKDCLVICKQIEEHSIARSLSKLNGYGRHPSFSVGSSRRASASAEKPRSSQCPHNENNLQVIKEQSSEWKSDEKEVFDEATSNPRGPGASGGEGVVSINADIEAGDDSRRGSQTPLLSRLGHSVDEEPGPSKRDVWKLRAGSRGSAASWDSTGSVGQGGTEMECRLSMVSAICSDSVNLPPGQEEEDERDRETRHLKRVACKKENCAWNGAEKLPEESEHLMEQGRAYSSSSTSSTMTRSEASTRNDRDAWTETEEEAPGQYRSAGGNSGAAGIVSRPSYTFTSGQIIELESNI